MGEPAQTPVVFILAGGSAFFDADCVAALAKCGLHPDDFGSYDHVKGRISSAKNKVYQYDQAVAKKTSPLPDEPTAHERLLAQSEAGHLRQNSLFQRERGNFCENEQANPGNPSQFPGAAGYHDALAPCGPHPVGSGGSKKGSTHWAVGREEAGLHAGRDAGTPVDSKEIKKHSLKCAELTAEGASEDQIESKAKRAKRIRKEEADARKASAAELQKESAGAVSGPGDVAGGDGAAEKAAECIDAFAEAGMDAMRQQVIDNFGTDEAFKKSKARLQAAEDKAKAEVDKAEKRLEDAKERLRQDPKNGENWAEFHRSKGALGRAKGAHAHAKAQNESAECLHQQAKDLLGFQQENGGALPEMSGSVPSSGGRPSKKRKNKRDRYTEKTTTDTDKEL
jgi:hypothetical protein